MHPLLTAFDPGRRTVDLLAERGVRPARDSDPLFAQTIISIPRARFCISPSSHNSEYRLISEGVGRLRREHFILCTVHQPYLLYATLWGRTYGSDTPYITF